MKTHLLVCAALAVCVSSLHAQPTPPSQSLCDMPSQKGTAIYNKYCGAAPSAGSVAPAAPTMQQQMGLAIGQAAMPILQQAVHDLFWGSAVKTPDVANLERERIARQNALAAQQLNNSGLYLLRQKNFSGAINEFQKALALNSGDPSIARNLALAQQQLKNTAIAAQTSAALTKFLGDAFRSAGPDSNQLTHAFVVSPNSSALNLINLDPSVVDLRGTTRTSVDPASLKDNQAIPPSTSARSDQQAVEDIDKALNFNAEIGASERQSQAHNDALTHDFQQTVEEINKQLFEMQKTQQRVQDEVRNAKPQTSGPPPPHN